jgi:hypothetical protein
MRNVGVWLEPVSHWLVAWLVSRWGDATVLLGTLALAVSCSVSLMSAYDHPAPAGVSVPGADISVPTQCTPSLLVVAPDIACNDR